MGTLLILPYCRMCAHLWTSTYLVTKKKLWPVLGLALWSLRRLRSVSGVKLCCWTWEHSHEFSTRTVRRNGATYGQSKLHQRSVFLCGVWRGMQSIPIGRRSTSQKHSALDRTCILGGSLDFWRHALLECNLAKCVWTLEREELTAFILYAR